MSDYTELVKALRYCAEKGDFKCGKDCPMRTEYPNCLTKMDTDAADAIEALQKTLKAVQTNSGINFRMWEEAQAELERLQAQLPKRGEWEREMDVYDEPFYQCSVCGECFDSNNDSTHEVFKYCPDCGAKMEVQDGD